MPTLGSLASNLRTVANVRRGEVYLIELDRDDRPVSSRGSLTPAVARKRFQYFPDSLTDNKQVNYSQKDVPGGSLPLYQYVNSGARQIAFTAVFTTDVDHYAFRGARTAASQDRSVNTDRVEDAYERLEAVGAGNRNVWIPAALQWLRRFMFPRYGEESQVGVPFTEPPRKLLLVFPGTEIHRNGGDNSFSTGGAIHCIMTQCDIQYEAFFPSGNPRIATASLVFDEVPQNQGRVKFPQVTTSADQDADFLYKLVPTDRSEFF